MALDMVAGALLTMVTAMVVGDIRTMATADGDVLFTQATMDTAIE